MTLLPGYMWRALSMRYALALGHFSAQPELFLTLKNIP